MKKNSLILLIILLFNYTYSQQNLVLNPSFESYTACPTSADQLNFSSNWNSYGETPDYFNICGTNGLTIPSNVAGYQNSFSGDSYAGFVAYCSNGFAREIIGAKLSQTLSIGIKYFASIKVSLAEFDAINKQYLPCNKIGIRFSTIPFSTLTPIPANNFAHVYTNNIIADTLNWVSIQGSFISDSNYKYIMIGNFFDDINTSITFRPNGIYSYFFLDDLCVSTDSLLCSMPVGINKNTLNESIKIFPSLIRDFVNIEGFEETSYTIILSNLFGFKIFEEYAISKSKFDFSFLPNGCYFLKIISKNGLSLIKKIIINH